MTILLKILNVLMILIFKKLENYVLFLDESNKIFLFTHEG
jgi:hypothetical protein